MATGTTTIKTYTTYEGQNVVDLALQLYGDPLAFFTLLDDNPHLSLEELIPSGTEVIYNEAKIDIKKRPLVEYFKNKLPNPVIIKTGSGLTGLPSVSTDASAFSTRKLG